MNFNLDKSINITQHLFSKIESLDKVVYYYNETEVLYRDVVENTSKFSSSILNQGVISGDRVVISLNDSPILSEIFFAVIAIGAIPVVVNPRLSYKNLHHIIYESEAKLVFVESDCIDFEKKSIHMSGKDKYPKFISNIKNEVCDITIQDLLDTGDRDWDKFKLLKHDEFALLQYTSGTTGKPKGVMHSSYSIFSACEYFAKNKLNINKNDVLYSIPKMFFGYGMGNSVLFPFYCGAAAIIDGNWPSLERIIYNISKYNPSVFFSVPAIYNEILNHHDAIENIKNIRILFSAGSYLPETIFNKWFDRYGMHIIDGIGATEMFHVFACNDLKDPKPGSTGKVLEGYSAEIIDSGGNVIKEPGVRGVLNVRGGSMSLGYWKRPDVTKDIFINNWYRTGDVFTVDNEGNLFCRGREDDLFKVNGRWLVPSEIEKFVSEEFSEIKEAVVVPVVNESNLHKPVIFVVSKKKQVPEDLSNSILNRISEVFEKYKKPIRCFFVDELPRNDNGKLLRKELSKMAVDLCLTDLELVNDTY